MLYRCITDEARELYWHTVHTGRVWKPIEDYFRHLEKFRAKGAYDPDKARKGLLAFISSSAKDYLKEYAPHDGALWARMFPMAARRQVAEEIMASTEAEWEVGNFYT